MRDIIKNIQLPIDGKPMDFRLTKLDAFSGAALLQLLTKLPGGVQGDLLRNAFMSMSPEDLRSVMTSCLNHVEVLLPAGYQPIMQGSSWSWPAPSSACYYTDIQLFVCFSLCLESQGENRI